MVRKARNRVFHLNCFTCGVCRKQLLTGEKLYVLQDESFVCKEDFYPGSRRRTRNKGTRGGSDFGQNDSEDENKKEKRRGPRTTIKAKQLEILKSTFNSTPKPRVTSGSNWPRRRGCPCGSYRSGFRIGGVRSDG
ncbi:Uncharacterized protein FKW44_016598 [Caligus rogercresseyi]|uniref:LIM zinc-binding domain-containing protein n=1 Tax=Caligus rogercresseyi TaxID=217165 RepID=A0A7T8H2C4_CALRO|nr:Uncharacterized protein FKW44_016598 [Caligus rogercresseyi]